MQPSAPQTVDVIILAGGINHIPLYNNYVPGYKALIPFNGKAAIRYVVEALFAVPAVQRICIVGPQDELTSALSNAQLARCEFVPGGTTLMDSITNGLKHFAASPAVLVTTADLPLLTPQAVSDFLGSCARVKTAYAHNILIAVVPDRYYTGAYAHFTKPFNRFKDVAICHGNLALVNPQILQNTAATERMNRIYNARKSPFSAALAIGLRIGLSYIVGVELLHQITLRRMARITSQRFQLGLIPVPSEHPEITIDLDEAADYRFIKEQLEPSTTQEEPLAS